MVSTTPETITGPIHAKEYGEDVEPTAGGAGHPGLRSPVVFAAKTTTPGIESVVE